MNQPIGPGRTGKQDVVYDLMRGGAGTPWENRGEHGAAGGFLKSVTRALLSPGLLFDHIRSTTVTTDAQTFLWICAACWGVGIAVAKGVQFFLMDASRFDVDTNSYFIASVIETAVAVGWAFLMFRLIILLYHKLVTTEVKQAVPATLTFNIGAYAMGPSLLAVIPIVGPLLATLGAFVALVAAGRKRLFVSWRGAIIDALLPFVVAFVATLALYFVGGFVIDNALSPITERPVVETKPQQQIDVPASPAPVPTKPGAPVQAYPSAPGQTGGSSRGR